MVMVIQVIHPTTHVMQYETKRIPSVITLSMHLQTLEKNATSYERFNSCYLKNCDRPLILPTRMTPFCLHLLAHCC